MEHEQLAMEFYQFCPQKYFVTAKKLSSNLESPHFPMFSAKCRECKIGKRDGHGKSRNGHGKVTDKYFVKYVETLLEIPVSKLLYNLQFYISMQHSIGNLFHNFILKTHPQD